MVVRVTTVQEFRAIIDGTKNAVLRGHGLALIQTGQLARRLAIVNAKNNFQEPEPKAGRAMTGRKLTGQLLKSIRVSFEISKAELPKAFLTVSGVPYGAIHEYGGIIRPKKARHLWIKMDYRTPYKRLTPKEFMDLRKQKDTRRSRGSTSYAIFRPNQTLIAAEIKSFKTKKARVRTLFVLKDRVTIPERPYLRPAAEKAAKAMGPLSAKLIAQEVKRRRRASRGSK